MASVPVQTLDDFVKLAKSQPGKLSYGSAGYGSVHHLTMALFEERAGINLLHVPYRGGTALVNGLLTGEIQAGWSGFPNVIALIETGKLKALCVSILKRSPSLPKVPTCDELGYQGLRHRHHDRPAGVGRFAGADRRPHSGGGGQGLTRSPTWRSACWRSGSRLQEKGTGAISHSSCRTIWRAIPTP